MSPAAVISRFTYTYDAAGNQQTVAEADGSAVTCSYDNTYQLTSETRSGANAFSRTYTYDDAGNRLSKADGIETTTYSYDSGNRLLTSEGTSGTTTFTYDADGNQLTQETQAGDITTNTWDQESRNTVVELPGSGGVVTHIYNGDDQRVAGVDSSGVVTSLVWDQKNVITDLDDAGLALREYTLEPLEFGHLLSERDDAGDSVWHHYDATGSSRDLTDSSEVTTDDAVYESFGGTIASTGSTATPYGFSMWLAGGGVRGGQTIGSTDDFGFRAVQDKVHTHDHPETDGSRSGATHVAIGRPRSATHRRRTRPRHLRPADLIVTCSDTHSSRIWQTSSRR